MLLDLAVTNYAIIDSLHVRFAPGFTAVTGETGAGKSIVIGALELLLGGRASADLIRTGEEEAVVEARFDLSRSADVRAALAEGGFPAEGELVVRRSVSREGRSRAWLNGRMAPVSLLRDLCTRLVNIYGQFEHQSLLAVDRHVEFLDAFGGHGALRAAVEAGHARTAAIVAERDALARRERERAQREGYLRFVVSEIEAARLAPDEEDRLRERRAVIRSAGKLREVTREGEEVLYAGEGAVHERLSGFRSRLSEVSGLDADLAQADQTLAQAVLLVEEARQRIATAAARLDFDPAEQEEIEARLAQIQALRRKYGEDVPAVLAHLARCREELTTLEGAESRRAELDRALAEARTRLAADARVLTAARRKAAGRLAREMERELSTLAMKGARFVVAIEPLPAGGGEVDADGLAVGPRGADRVEFLLSANVGEEPRPLARIASGGELSRIMLAIKRVLDRLERVPTLIFDEVDAGIGGQVAEVVGEKLAAVAREHQVLVVTHLPQIARWAAHHLHVGKTESKGRTRTLVRDLSPEERVQEIARMLAGDRITRTTLAHAQEMLAAGKPAP